MAISESSTAALASALPEERRYSAPAVWLHWMIAALGVTVATLGLLHDSWPDSTQAFWINLHALLGLTLFALMWVRLAWRLGHEPPRLTSAHGPWAARLSTPVHLLIYLLLFVIPCIGIVTFIWHGRAFHFGLFTIDPGVKKDRSIFHPTEEWHGDLAYVLFALVALHVGAALWHQFVRRDRLLDRMLLRRGS